jgi:hypothetical protein
MSTQTVGMISTGHTVYIVQDFFETFVLSDLLDYLRHRVCSQPHHPLPQIKNYSTRTEANTDEGEYDQLRDHQERKIACDNCTV